jgi:hypothetical protein
MDTVTEITTIYQTNLSRCTELVGSVADPDPNLISSVDPDRIRNLDPDRRGQKLTTK